jgi:hypothetical protein
MGLNLNYFTGQGNSTMEIVSRGDCQQFSEFPGPVGNRKTEFRGGASNRPGTTLTWSPKSKNIIIKKQIRPLFEF